MGDVSLAVPAIHPWLAICGEGEIPSPGGRDRSSAFQTMTYTLCLIPLAFLPSFFHQSSLTASIILIICGILFAIQSFSLFRKMDVRSAQQLMFGSFIYLPLVQIVLMVDKLI
jgi:protoheme IX farnesyltransferase